MTFTAHVVGMGWLGAAVVAPTLDTLGAEWTWSDPEVPHRHAWRASTGCVYPDGDPAAADAYTRWQEWLTTGDWPAASTDWWSTTVAPPHGATCGYDLTAGWVSRTTDPAIIVDVAAVVLADRDRYRARRTDPMTDDADVTIIATGHPAARRWTWGWSAPVTLTGLDLPPSDRRPSFNLWASRYRNGYAYAAPNTDDVWWAGSSAITQNDPHPLDPYPHFARWIDLWHDTAPPGVSATPVGEPRQGWRPVPHGPIHPTVTVDPDGTIRLPALQHSGVRLAPLVADNLHATLVRVATRG